MLNMSSTERKRAIDLAREDGLVPEQMSVSQWRKYSLRVRTPKELVVDTVAATRSFVDTEIRHVNRVSDERYEAVKKICIEECPAKPKSALHVLNDGKYLCDRCDCAGKMLNSKWRHTKSKCPLGAWDNAEATRTDGVPDGERTAPTGVVLDDHAV